MIYRISSNNCKNDFLFKLFKQFRMGPGMFKTFDECKITIRNKQEKELIERKFYQCDYDQIRMFFGCNEETKNGLKIDFSIFELSTWGNSLEIGLYIDEEDNRASLVNENEELKAILDLYESLDPSRVSLIKEIINLKAEKKKLNRMLKDEVRSHQNLIREQMQMRKDLSYARHEKDCIERQINDIKINVEQMNNEEVGCLRRFLRWLI